MEDEKLADKLLDRILMVLMPYDQIDVERIKAKLTVVLDDYQICPKQEALVVYTEGKNDYYLRKFLLAKTVQDAVKSSVESVAGLTVAQVNVNICGIAMPKELKK